MNTNCNSSCQPNTSNNNIATMYKRSLIQCTSCYVLTGDPVDDDYINRPCYCGGKKIYVDKIMENPRKIQVKPYEPPIENGSSFYGKYYST